MDQTDLFLLFTRPLDREKIPYMATGSVAAMIYGTPRFTHDLDLVIALQMESVEHFEAMYPENIFYRPPQEVIRVEIQRSQRGHFNLIHHDSGLKADIYLTGKDDLHTWGMSNKRRIELQEGDGIWVAPPEYVILRKLQYFQEGHSEKHLQDIRGMFDVSGDQIDQQYLNSWLDRLNLQSEFEKTKD